MTCTWLAFNNDDDCAGGATDFASTVVAVDDGGGGTETGNLAKMTCYEPSCSGSDKNFDQPCRIMRLVRSQVKMTNHPCIHCNTIISNILDWWQ